MMSTTSHNQAALSSLLFRSSLLEVITQAFQSSDLEIQRSTAVLINNLIRQPIFCDQTFFSLFPFLIPILRRGIVGADDGGGSGDGSAARKKPKLESAGLGSSGRSLFDLDIHRKLLQALATLSLSHREMIRTDKHFHDIEMILRYYQSSDDDLIRDAADDAFRHLE